MTPCSRISAEAVLGRTGVGEHQVEVAQRGEPVQRDPAELGVVDHQHGALRGAHHRPLDQDDLLFLVVGVAAGDRRGGGEEQVDPQRLDRLDAGHTEERVVGRVVLPAEREQPDARVRPESSLMVSRKLVTTVSGVDVLAAAGRVPGCWSSRRASPPCPARSARGPAGPAPASRRARRCSRYETLLSKTLDGCALTPPRYLRTTPWRSSSSRSRWIVIRLTSNSSASSVAETEPCCTTYSAISAWRWAGRLRSADGSEALMAPSVVGGVGDGLMLTSSAPGRSPSAPGRCRPASATGSSAASAAPNRSVGAWPPGRARAAGVGRRPAGRPAPRRRPAG